VEQELLILPEQLSSPPVFSGVPVEKKNHFPIGCHFETLSYWISYLHSIYSLQRKIKLRCSLALINLAAFEQNYELWYSKDFS
jgi:hypothetical protein